MTTTTPAGPAAGTRIAVLTSGGDAQGMNAAVRAVVRTSLGLGAEVYAVYEGYQGLVDGGDGIRRFEWDDVGSILHKGGTKIGTFRSTDFRTREGRTAAARNLLAHGIDRVVVVGGDGSLSGLNTFAEEWSGILEDLVASGDISAGTATSHPRLHFAGMVGSIDNDLVGSSLTIGADSALHRILDAIDSLKSTAASHQRSFVIEVMGRHCGYLALMAAIAGGCDYTLIPEAPPEDGWEDRMCAELKRARGAGHRDSIVIVAEGATDQHGTAIRADDVKRVIEDRLQEDTRVTILGHVQRGGTPSAFDRWCSTWLGYEAARNLLLDEKADERGSVIGFTGYRARPVPLMEAVRQTRRVPELIAAGDFAGATELRGGSFQEMLSVFRELTEPSRVSPEPDTPRIGIVHAGGLAPGMNSAAQYAVRLGISRGYRMVGILGGFPGLRDGNLQELGWEDVEGWTGEGGARLGLRRNIPTVEELYTISRQLEEHRIDALLVIGGWNAYQAAHLFHVERDRYPALRLPIVCIPASIDNNLPGSEVAIGTDTALNDIVAAVDRIKQSAEAVTRAFVIETMGRWCGYLALMSGLAAGAERIYLHEDGITLDRLNADIDWVKRSFAADRNLFLAVRGERANPNYTTDVIARLLDEEGQGAYDVRTAVIGHQQQGGNPSPADRTLAARLVSAGLRQLDEELVAGTSDGHYLGLVRDEVVSRPLAEMMDEMDTTYRRPKDQWWLELKDVVDAVNAPDEP
jgi:6-phosphofructokinase 1